MFENAKKEKYQLNNCFPKFVLCSANWKFECIMGLHEFAI